jgi:transposase
MPILAGTGAAAIYSLVGSAELNGPDPALCLRQVKMRIAQHAIKRIEETLLWNIKTDTVAT